VSDAKSRGALRWSYVLTWTTKGINIASMLVLARILGPESFGVAALAMVFVLFIEMFAESGLAPAIVQRKDLDPADLDSIFWLNMALAVPLAAAGYLASDLLGHVVDDPQVPAIFAALSPLILFRGLGVVQFALAQREMRFKDLAIRSAAGAAIGGLAGIGSAVVGLGIWSLVVQYIVTDLVSLVLLWRLSSWRPRFRFELRRARSFLRFSSGVIVSQVAVFASNQADVFVMGALFGATAVGIFRLAMRVVNILIEMLVRPVQAIALPRLAALRDEPDRMHEEVLRLMRISSLAMLPAVGALMIGADAVTSLLGERWSTAADAMKVLALIGVAKSLSLLTGPTMLALGRSHTVALGSVGQAFVTIGAIICAGLWAKGLDDTTQVVAVASARSGVFLLLVMPFQIRYMSRATGIGVSRVIRAVLPGIHALLATVAVGIAAEYVLVLIGADRLATNWGAAIAGGLVAGALILRARRAMPKKSMKPKKPKKPHESMAGADAGADAEPSAPSPDRPSVEAGGMEHPMMSPEHRS
jgi:O-antigen/teichoic acid export membrane protein